MEYNRRSTSQGRLGVTVILVVGLAWLFTFRISSAARTDYSTNFQQETIRLEARFNQMEQRLYSIEASLRNLEQQSRVASANSRAANQDDSGPLRIEIQLLQARLIDDECALAKLDERTLSPDTRAARKRSGTVNNPCRISVDTPLRLPNDR
jgi:hypothetical protein